MNKFDIIHVKTFFQKTMTMAKTGFKKLGEKYIFYISNICHYNTDKNSQYFSKNAVCCNHFTKHVDSLF